MRILAFCLGLTLAAAAMPCDVAAATGRHNDCYHNAKGQLVCRTCWNEAGKVHCNKPRIVRG